MVRLQRFYTCHSSSRIRVGHLLDDELQYPAADLAHKAIIGRRITIRCGFSLQVLFQRLELAPGHRPIEIMERFKG